MRIEKTLDRGVLREARWLTADRVVAATRVLLVVLFGLTSAIPFLLPGMNVGRDFAAFWTAARLAQDGRAAEAYGDPGRAALEALFGSGVYPPFVYPPTALLIWLPFALLPFALAVAVWIALSGLAYGVAMRAIGGIVSVLPAISFPAVLVCALYGQNALFSAALLGGAAATLQRYPALCGILLGCLGYKPQLFMLAPIALLAARRWRALFACLLTPVIVAACSLVAFGTRTWVAFFAALPAAGAWNANGVPGFDKFVSFYAAARLSGLPASVASAIQATVIVLAVGALLVLLRRRPGGPAEVSVLTIAIMLSVPFLGEYDFVMAAVPGAWIAAAARHGWAPYERVTLALLFFAPLAIKAAAVHDVPLAPLASVALAILVFRRVLMVPETRVLASRAKV